MPVLSNDHHPTQGKAPKDLLPLVMPVGKPGPGCLKHIKTEPQHGGSRRSSSKRPPVEVSDVESEVPLTKRSHGGKAILVKAKATASQKKPIEPVPSHGTHSQTKPPPSPMHEAAADPTANDDDDQEDQDELLEELNTITSGPGIGGIPVINCRLNKSFPPPSMVPGEGGTLKRSLCAQS
ncbi:hypothetical protein EDD18DRAFT_1343741 [Armillaria luteobubalina]|uniref:Uncharacterized protein n=1 Tax=Armillaria luteobubalina TaxID=153913 RepID=A0AA39QNL8_9AGAR|nr:hypothetical protein EDD18DRAFT_1343741 [Armillaria luteobubalina]